MRSEHHWTSEGYPVYEGITRRRVILSVVAALCIARVRGQSFSEGSAGVRNVFSAEEMTFIGVFADTLIPQTDTPGAIEAGVPISFVELMGGWASTRRRSTTTQVILSLRADLRRRAGENFVTAGAAVRTKSLEALDADAYGPKRDLYCDYRDIKALLVRLYYASKAGVTLELRYDPVPGGYLADVPFADVGRTWAT